MKRIINTLVGFFLVTSAHTFGQMSEYDYKRELHGVSNQWHKLVLPDDIFGKISQDLSDMRIFGITSDNDTIEAPYLLVSPLKNTSSKKQIDFDLINASYTENGYYFTFEIPTIESVNSIKLEFSQKNFDWITKLEGSQNQRDWYTITDNYRILSINNKSTDFQFTDITFPSSKYRFFRLFVQSKEKPNFTVASIALNELEKQSLKKYSIQYFGLEENRKTKQTEIDIELPLPIPISKLSIIISDTFDYYRPVTIQYLADSIHTDVGWKFNYKTLTTGTLNSIDRDGFNFSSTTVKKIKIFIHNQANQPLSIENVQLQGPEHELVARFTEEATYFLSYGNDIVSIPTYDIDRFTDKIPKLLTSLKLGEELIIDKGSITETEPLFKNKTWLWVVMTLMILLLGWFSFKMITK